MNSKMNAKELDVILGCIRNVRDVIADLAFDRFPYSECKDDDLKEMFFELNKMAIAVDAKRMEAER